MRREQQKDYLALSVLEELSGLIWLVADAVLNIRTGLSQADLNVFFSLINLKGLLNVAIVNFSRFFNIKVGENAG